MINVERQSLRAALASAAPRIDKDSSSCLFDDGYTRRLTQDDFRLLQKRLGSLHAKLRLGIEADALRHREWHHPGRASESHRRTSEHSPSLGGRNCKLPFGRTNPIFLKYLNLLT
jgi:hypothetical protein